MKKEMKPIYGVVFDIQRYSIHDGPGIRTLIFLKGCPLRCKWCSNPESQKSEPQIFYLKSHCIRCSLCIKNCPNQVIKMKDEGIEIDWENVNIGELSWVDSCPTGALSVKGKTMSVEEVFEIIMKDEIFYRQGGGGVTITGGEPLMQSQFAYQLLKRVYNEGISTAVETTGAVPEDTLMSILPYVDLFLFDYKHYDDKAHKKYTCASNIYIKNNLKMLSEAGANIMVRMPLIPGVNDSEECIKKVMDVIKEYGIYKFDLLPFHQYGSGKYISIGIPYEMQDTMPPDESHLLRLRNMITEAGFSRDY